MYEAWVRIANPLAADFDEDGDVDAGDLAAWRLGYGMLTNAEHYAGDADGDGDVDGRDFLVWQQQIGSGALQAVASVPEPQTLWLVLSALLGTAALGGRTR